MVKVKHAALGAALWMCGMLWSGAASAQTVPEINGAPCTLCAPTGWVIDSQSPDFINGNGPWPGGGGWVVDSVSGASPQGGGMAMLVSTPSATYRESIRATITGLTAGVSYRACFFYEASRVVNGGQAYSNGTFRITINGAPTSFPQVAAWTRACAPFVATAATATVILAIDSSGDGTDGGMIVVDGGGPSAIELAGCTTNAQCGGATPLCDVGSGQCVACLTAANCSDNNTCTQDVCTAGVCSNPPAAAGTACAGGVCNGQLMPACVTCLNNTIGGQDAGCSAAQPACITRGGMPTCVECESDLACGPTELCDPAGACQAAFVDITTPVNDAQTNDNTPTIAGTANAGEPVAVSVSPDQGGAPVFQGTATATGGMWTLDTAALPDGLYLVSATITAAGGQVGESVRLRVDTTAPAVAILTPASGAQTNDATPTLSGAATDTNGGGVASLTVEVLDAMGQVVFMASPMLAAGAWSVDASALPEGSYTVRVTAVDNAGNASQPVTAPFVVDTTAPAVALVTPADESLTNDGTPALSGTAEAGAALEVVVRDMAGMIVFTGAPAVAADGTWSVDSAALPDGAYTVQATATDAAGNAASSASHSVVIDTTAPVVSVIAPADQALISDTRPMIVGTSEADAALVIELVDAQGAIIETLNVTADMAGAWGVAPAMMLADGAYTIRVVATDAAGNASQPVESTFTIDTTALPLTISAPTAGALVAVAPAIVGATAPGAEVTVELVDAQGAVIETLTATADAMGGWSVTPTMASAEGSYTVRAAVTSAAGVVSTATTSFTLDATAPALTITAPAAGAVLTAAPMITGTSEPGAAIVVEIKDAAGAVIETLTATADMAGMWSVTPATVLADGAYTAQATATDAAGNASQPATRDFTVDMTAPQVTITAPMAGQQVTSTSPTITGTAEPGATVTILIDGVSVGMATADMNGMWSFMAPTLTVGTHTVEATTTDAAGNAGSSGSVSFEVAEGMMSAPVAIVTPVEGGMITGPSVTVTGTGEPGATITVTVGEQTKTVVVGEDGAWSVTFDVVPAGATTIGATDGSTSVTINVTVSEQPVVEDDTDLVLAGGCAQGAGGQAGSLWMLALGALALVRRRRA